MNVYGANVVTLANVVATVVVTACEAFANISAHSGKEDNSG